MENHGAWRNGVYPKISSACPAKRIYEDKTLWLSQSQQLFFNRAATWTHFLNPRCHPWSLTWNPGIQKTGNEMRLLRTCSKVYCLSKTSPMGTFRIEIKAWNKNPFLGHERCLNSARGMLHHYPCVQMPVFSRLNQDLNDDEWPYFQWTVAF